MFYVLLCVIYVHSNYLEREERAGYFTLSVFLVSRDYCVALPHDVMGLSAVCDCGIF